MKYFLLISTIFIMVFASCSSESGLKKEISQLETILDKEPTTEHLSQLIKAYSKYINDNPEDEEWNGRYSYRMASRQLQAKNPSAAVRVLDEGVKNYTGSSITPSSLYLLGQTYANNFRQASTAEQYYQALVEGFPSNEYAVKAKDLMKENKSLDDRILASKDDIYRDSTKTRLDTRKVRKVVELYSLYSSVMPNSDKTPGYLYNIYNLANSAGMYKDAVSATEKLYTKYPNHDKASSAMFLSGYLYENNLGKLDKAREIYTSFLEKYPNDPFAKDARVILEGDNLGKSAEEMLNNVRKQNSGQ